MFLLVFSQVNDEKMEIPKKKKRMIQFILRKFIN